METFPIFASCCLVQKIMNSVLSSFSVIIFTVIHSLISAMHVSILFMHLSLSPVFPVWKTGIFVDHLHTTGRWCNVSCRWGPVAQVYRVNRVGQRKDHCGTLKVNVTGVTLNFLQCPFGFCQWDMIWSTPWQFLWSQSDPEAFRVTRSDQQCQMPKEKEIQKD